MFRNRYYNCSCECKCEQPDVLDEIQESICQIKEGIKYTKCGFDLICCRCRICEGIRCIEKGTCFAEKGLAGVVDGVKSIEFECEYRCNANIKNGVCGINEGVRSLREAICRLRHCCLCEGIENVQSGLCQLEEGLCYLVKGIDDLKSEEDCRKKSKSCC